MLVITPEDNTIKNLFIYDAPKEKIKFLLPKVIVYMYVHMM